MATPFAAANNQVAPEYNANSIKGCRKTLDQSQWGPAAPAKSHTLRIRDHGNKPAAKRWDHFLSKESAGRAGNSLKYAAEFLSMPGMISLGGGLPSSEYFPWAELQFKVPPTGEFSEKAMQT